jgi:hypothetical protein
MKRWMLPGVDLGKGLVVSLSIVSLIKNSSLASSGSPETTAASRQALASSYRTTIPDRRKRPIIFFSLAATYHAEGIQIRPHVRQSLLWNVEETQFKDLRVISRMRRQHIAVSHLASSVGLL